MPENINLNIAPYNDDYDASKNFYRVLFRPGYSIQTRELTSLQSILQNQIESHGRHQFKQGDLVVPGEVGLNNKLNYVKLSSVAEVPVNENNQIVYKKYDIKKLIGQKLQGVTSGVIATVLAVEYSTENSSDTLYVKYVSSGDSNQEFTFRQGETLEVINGVNTPLLYVGTDGNVLPTSVKLVDPDTKKTTSITSPAMGFASAVQVQEGIYFVNGFFVRNQEELLIIDKYYNQPSAKVGFIVEEDIVTPEEDSSLYDNSRGSSNYASPGAHRLKITLKLKSFDYDSPTDKNFIELLRVKSGVIQKKVKETNYSLLEETLARRTYDESGDYVVSDFPVEIREYYQKDNNLGVYSKNENNLVNGLSEIEASRKMVASVGPGKAYVKGFEIVNKETKYLDINKARDTLTRENVTLKSKGLSEFKISNVYGSIPLNAETEYLTAYPTVYLQNVFNDGSVGLNSIGNSSTFKTVSRRGQDFGFVDSEVGTLDKTDIGIKTICVDLSQNTSFNSLNDVTELWFIKTRTLNKTVSTQGYAKVLGYSVVRKPEINNASDKKYVEFVVCGRKDLIIEFLTEYDDGDSSGTRKVYLSRSDVRSGDTTKIYGTIVDYTDVITPVIGISKANDFKLAKFGSGFNKDKDKIVSKGKLPNGSATYNSIFSVNYFNPVFFTRLLLDTNVITGFTVGKYIQGSKSGAYGVIEGKDNGYFSTKNILMVKTLFGTFIPGETIIDENGNSLRIAKENTVSHFVVKKIGTGYLESAKVKLNGVEFNPSDIKVNILEGALNRIEIRNRNVITTEYSQPPIVEVSQDGSGSKVIVEAVLFKNTVLTYTPQNVKSLFSAYGSSNSNIFTSDVELSDTSFIESKQVTEFTFSGLEGNNYIECNGFGSDASLLLVQGDFIQFADVDGNVVRGFVKYATKPEGTKKSRIYLNYTLTKNVSNATVIRQRPIVENSSSASLIFPTGGKEVSSIAKDVTDTKIKYYFRRDFVIRSSSSGSNITFSAQLPFGTQRFTEFNEENYVLTVLDRGDSNPANGGVDNGDIIYVNKSYVTINSATQSNETLTAGSITINFPQNYFGTNLTRFPILKLTATLEVTKAKFKLKTSIKNKRIIIKSNKDVVIPLRGQDYDTNSVEVNSYSDAYRLRHVFEGTSASPPSVDSNNNLIKGTDVTDRFTFDDGQRDTVYDVSRIVLKPGFEAPVGQLVVVFDYFEHSQGDFCTVDSYLHEAGVTADEVGTFNSSVYGIVSLKDVFDFRPKVDSTTVVTGFQDKSYISQVNYVSFSGSGGTFSSTPASDKGLEYTISFDETRYLDRIDGIFLDKKGKFIVKEGNSSLNPSKPESVDDAIPLYYVYVPSYTKSSKDVRITPVDNKRYTMRDIGKLEKRIERLEYYTTLSILEQQALNMQIKDEIGLDKFKTGFIVDNFESHKVGNFKSSDYKCSIDTQQAVLRPSVKEDSFELEEVYKREDQRITAGYKKSSNIITLPYSNVTLLGNTYATKSVNPNPFVVLQYVGDVNITPTIDQWYDNTVAPLITENNTNLYSVFLSKDDVEEGFSSIYNSFMINWVGVNKVFYNLNSFANNNTEVATSSVEQALVASSSNVTPQNNELAKGVTSNTINDLTVSSTLKYFARSIPVKFVIRRLLPKTTVNVFIDGKNVNRWVIPDSRFTGIAGNSLTSFNAPIVTDSNGNASGIILIPAGKPPRENTSWTNDVKTVAYDDAAEELRFTAGNKIIRFTSSATDESKDKVATYAEVNFYASGIIPQNPASIVSTKPAYFKANEGVQLVGSNTDVESRPNPLAQTFKIENYEGGVFVTGVDLFFVKKSSTIPIKVYLTNIESGKPGKYIVPGAECTLTPETYLRVYSSGTLTLKIGEEVKGSKSNASGPLLKVLDKNNIEVSATTAGIVTLNNDQVYTLVLSNHNGKSFIEEPVTTPSLIQNNNLNNTSLTLNIAKDSGKIVDLKVTSVGSNYESATILVESPQLPGGSNCTGTVDVSNGMIYNANIILSGSGYTEAPSIVIRGNGQGANGAVVKAEIEIDTPAIRMGVATDIAGKTRSVTPTRFEFSYPIYLQNDTEYALCIETDSIDYELWASRLGEIDVVSNVSVTSQPLLGSVYRSQNIDVWTEDIFEDIKFNLYRAEFDITRSGEILLTNKNLGYERLKSNPFETYALANTNATSNLFKNNNSIVKVNHRDHGFETNKKSYVFFKSAEDVGGISGLSLNTSLYQVFNSGLDHYNIVALNRAGSNQIGGGSKVLSSYNRKYERLYAQIPYLQLPKTTIDTSVKTTNIIPVDSNTNNYLSYSQTNNFEKTFLYQEHFFTNQKVIASRVNEVTNDIENSLVYKIVINSSVSYLSPVIDLESASVKTTTNRIENSTGYENRFGKRYQILKFLPVYEFNVSGATNITAGQNVTGLNTGATGKILKSDTSKLWVKLTSFNGFEAGEGLKFSNQTFTNAPTVSTTGPVEVNFNFQLNTIVVAFNPLDTTKKYDNKITGKVILWNPKTKELTLEVDKYPINGDYTSKITTGSAFSRENVANQIPDIFRVGDILYYEGISSGTEQFAEVSEIMFTTGIEYSPENGSKASSSVAKYVTKEISLNNPSTGIDVRLTMNIKDSSNVKVLYKIKESSSESNFDDINWNYFNEDGSPDIDVQVSQFNSISGQFEKQQSYQEFKYSVANLPEFTSFAVKIVMTGDDPVYVPKIQDIRTVASI